MSTKRRRHGTVEAPNLSDLISPETVNKRLKLDHASPLTVLKWTSEHVCDYLRNSGLEEDVCKAFKGHAIRGKHLLHLTEEELEKIGIHALGDRKDIMRVVKELNKRKLSGQEKVFNDPIHGHIELHPLLVKIIDTPQFQRLRYIKQLGGAYFVYPGASHNRFEHSIGVGYLAGNLVGMLQTKQPELAITDEDVLCVKVAGLCHDLGHGPFSHMWDGVFIPLVDPMTEWKHEVASVMMFDYLVSSNNLMMEFERYGLTSRDLKFIKEQIAGPLESEMCSQSDTGWPYEGRSKEQSFLYEIVANKRNGIDVDKWDYFARDCHCLGIPTNFDYRRCLQFARVIEVCDRRQICTRDKEVGNLYEMFHTRSSLHRRAYQHKTANIIEWMLTEALVRADNYFTLPGTDGKQVSLSESIHDPQAYTRLTDHIVQHILASTDPNLKESRDILSKIERRELYKCVGQTAPGPGKVLHRTQRLSLAADIIASLSEAELRDLPPLTSDDLVVDVVTFDYGMKDMNPVDHMRFYKKDHPFMPVRVGRDQVSDMLPQIFMEQSVRVYCKRLDRRSLQAATKYFLAWCKRECLGSEDGDETLMEFNESDTTPYSTPFKNTQKLEESRCTPSPNKDASPNKDVKRILFKKSS